MISKFRVSLLTALLMPVLMQAELSINDDHKPVVDFSKLKLSEPSMPLYVGGPAVVLGVIGALAGAQSGNATTAGAVLAVIGGAIGYREHAAFSDVHGKAHGLNLHGTAAQNNVVGTKALLEYHQGWYLFKGNDGNPRNLDGASNTPLHYAAAADALQSAKEIIAVAPKTWETEKRVGVSRTKRDATHTSAVSAHGRSGLIGALVTPVANVAVGESVGAYGATTTGGNTEKTDTKIVDHVYLDEQNDAGRTAANLVARTRAAMTLKMLIDKGAKVKIADNSDENVETICQNDPILRDALNKAKGK